MLDYVINLLTQIAAFVLVLGVLVFVHELGHFVTAKWAKIKVEEFAFGYPPRLFTIMKRGDTEYTVNLLPLGGFVRMLGEEDPTNPGSFASKAPWKRAVVLVAGGFMNVVLAVVLLTSTHLLGRPEGPPTGYIQVTAVADGSPAQQVGVQPNDYIVYVGNQRVRTVEALNGLVQRFYDREVTLTILRDGQEVDLKIVPRSRPPEGQGSMGVQIWAERETVKLGPLAALGAGLRETATGALAILQGLGDLVTRLTDRVDNNEPAVAGPVGIAQAAGEIATQGRATDLMLFTALLSINLAIINLLPIPALDGGRLLFVLIEALRGGRRLDPQKEGLVHLAGMMFLLTLILFISYFDVMRIVRGVPFLR